MDDKARSFLHNKHKTETFKLSPGPPEETLTWLVSMRPSNSDKAIVAFVSCTTFFDMCFKRLAMTSLVSNLIFLIGRPASSESDFNSMIPSACDACDMLDDGAVDEPD